MLNELVLSLIKYNQCNLNIEDFDEYLSMFNQHIFLLILNYESHDYFIENLTT